MPRWQSTGSGLAVVTAQGVPITAGTSIMKLTRTDIACLAAAAQRQDHLVLSPRGLSVKTRRSALARLLRAGVAEEVAVADEALGWRVEAQTTIGLRITAAGLAALEPREDASEREAPRPTKRAMVIALLAREEGARIGEMTAATGWQPHTVRAALTGLRRSGIAIEASRDAHGTLYRIPAPARAGEG